ncbi:citrate/2-methylcitrate synthase [Mobiluncus mulieris]|nr:citrate/2-methylcitrate synthase [Mobiluncus mulieris]
MSRHLYPNVDFYTGLIYRAMGFRMKMFTPLFAIGGCRVGLRNTAR